MTSLKSEIIKSLEDNMMFKYTAANSEELIDHDYHEKKVLDELKYHVGNQSYSALFLDQLTQLHSRNYVEIQGKLHPYNITDVYWMLESIIKKELKYKKFSKRNSVLFGQGIFHVHHSKSFYIEDNHIRYIKTKYETDESVVKRINEISKERTSKNLVHEFVYETLIESMNWKYKTGEWILFQNNDDNYHFIGLELHNTDDKNDLQLHERIKKH